jgi:16S rRNA C1402 (ribose-2'-O) methylase RsmI
MDRTLALQLIHPLREGSVLASGVALDAVEIHQDIRDHRKDKIHLTFASDLVILIAKRGSGASAFETANFAISINHTQDVLSESNRQVVSELKSILMSNDHAKPTVELHGPERVPERHPQPPDIWLIPGHIGNPLDLTVRTLRVLKTVDVIAVEPGSERSLEHIFDLFELGPIPSIMLLDNDAAIQRNLEAALANNETVALFGVNEGLPGMCDPGWRLLKAARQLKPEPNIKSLATGSALTTALLYADHAPSTFAFLGLFIDEDGGSKFMDTLYGLLPDPREENRVVICFAQGDQLIEHWAKLVSVTRLLRGHLTLFANVSRINEYTHRLALQELSRTPPDGLSMDDKVVVRIDLLSENRIWAWILRLLRRLVSPFR